MRWGGRGPIGRVRPRLQGTWGTGSAGGLRRKLPRPLPGCKRGGCNDRDYCEGYGISEVDGAQGQGRCTGRDSNGRTFYRRCRIWFAVPWLLPGPRRYGIERTHRCGRPGVAQNDVRRACPDTRLRIDARSVAGGGRAGSCPRSSNRGGRFEEEFQLGVGVIPIDDLDGGYDCVAVD